MNRFTTSMPLANLAVGVAVALMLTPLAEATLPRSWGPCAELHEGLRQAFLLEDEITRQAAIHDLLFTHLLSNDPRYVESVYSYLLENERWLDLSPHSAVFFTCAEAGHPGHRAHIADLPRRSCLRRAPRHERLLIYREALQTGSAEVPPWTRKCTRREAIYYSVLDGLFELEEDIRMACAQVKMGFQVAELDFLFLTLELRAGAESRDDAVSLAANRLSEMDPLEFRKAAENNPAFAHVVSQTVKEACSVSPFDGSQLPGCAPSAEMYVTQFALVLCERQRTSPRADPHLLMAQTTLPRWMYETSMTWMGYSTLYNLAYERCQDRATGSLACEMCVPERYKGRQATREP